MCSTLQFSYTHSSNNLVRNSAIWWTKQAADLAFSGCLPVVSLLVFGVRCDLHETRSQTNEVIVCGCFIRSEFMWRWWEMSALRPAAPSASNSG